MKPTRGRLVAWLAAVVVGLAIVGCGGDGAEEELSAEGFRSAADAVCQDYREQLLALGEPTFSERREGTFLEKGLTLQREQLDELEDLEPPEELQSDWDEAIALLEDQVAATQGIADAVAGGENPEEALSAAAPAIARREAAVARVVQNLKLGWCAASELIVGGEATR